MAAILTSLCPAHPNREGSIESPEDRSTMTEFCVSIIHSNGRVTRELFYDGRSRPLLNVYCL